MHAQFGNLIQFASEDTSQATFSGSVYRKQLAKYQDWVNPDYPWFSEDPIMTLDEEWGLKIVENFTKDTLGSPVPVPFNHTDDVKENTGRVLSLESVAGDGLYGELQIDDPKAVDALDKGIIFDVSISFSWDFIRTDDSKHYGPTLCHVALVNTPYLMGMNGFEKVGAALSRLEESFKPVGLSLAGTNVMMLSRTKMKELSAMATATIKNDKDFPVTVTFKDGDADETAVLQPGEEIVVSDDVAEDVTSQIADATEPAAGDDESTGDAAGTSGDTNAGTEGGDTGDANDGADEQSELSRLKQENAELKLSQAYDTLLAEGKVTPAQKDKIMGLAKLAQGVELSTTSGKKIDLASVVLDILGSGKQQFSTEESGSSKEDPNAATTDQSTEGTKKPSEALSEEELAGFKAVGADPKKMDELAEKDPVYAEALASLSKK